MRKKIILILMVVAISVVPLFATRIGITYNGVEYILNTSKAITANNQNYFSGMYDGFACVQQGYTLNKIYEVIKAKNFADMENPEEAKAEYEEAITDFMTNYSYGTDGNFVDIWPRYKNLMSSPVSFANAQEIVYFGSARFYPKNI